VVQFCPVYQAEAEVLLHLRLTFAPSGQRIGPLACVVQRVRIDAVRDRVAVHDPGDHGRQLAFSGDHEHLIDQSQPVCDPAHVDQGSALIPSGQPEQVGVVEAAGDVRGLACRRIARLVVFAATRRESGASRAPRRPHRIRRTAAAHERTNRRRARAVLGTTGYARSRTRPVPRVGRCPPRGAPGGPVRERSRTHPCRPPCTPTDPAPRDPAQTERPRDRPQRARETPRARPIARRHSVHGRGLRRCPSLAQRSAGAHRTPGRQVRGVCHRRRSYGPRS
jgi:hypothetical protein